MAPTGQVLERIARTARTEAGLDLGDRKGSMIHARLRRRLKTLELDSYEGYCDLLESSTPTGERERLQFVEALTTNVTSFFREPHHFEYLADRVSGAPPCRNRPIRVLSAGCSNGSEPVSILLTICATNPDLPPGAVRIEGIDINGTAIDVAGRHVYPSDAMTGEMIERCSPYLEAAGPGRIALSSKWRRCLDYSRANLVGSDFGSERYDVIFCRNVTIYFDPDTTCRVHRMLANALVPGGLICLGHSERLAARDAAGPFRRIGTTAYVKEVRTCP